MLAGGATFLIHLTDLQLSHFLLQVSNILAAIANVGVDSLLHEGIVSRLPHVTGSGDEGLLPLDLAEDRGDQLVPIHNGRRDEEIEQGSSFKGALAPGSSGLLVGEDSRGCC